MKKTVYTAEGKIKLVTDVVGDANGTGWYGSETRTLKVFASMATKYKK